MRPILAVTTGDPFGIGPEICLRAATAPAVLETCRPLLIGDRAHLLRVAARLGASGAASWPDAAGNMDVWGSKQGDHPAVTVWDEGPAFFDLRDAPDRAADGPAGGAPPGPTAAGGRSAVMYIKQAVMLARAGTVAAIVTAPISKTAMHLAGHRYPGHTELLADLCGLEPEDVAMLFVAGDLKVALLTVHLGLREAIEALSADRIAARLRLLRDEHRRWFGADPRLAVCALNPHGGEGGMFGGEEMTILKPAVDRAAAEGIRVSGPYPADTLFVRAAKGEFDAVLALHHDQATIAVKARAFGSAVNMTLGLPFLRTSVDHGTAYDIAGKGLADPGSLVEAIRLAAQLAK